MPDCEQFCNEPAQVRTVFHLAENCRLSRNTAANYDLFDNYLIKMLAPQLPLPRGRCYNTVHYCTRVMLTDYGTNDTCADGHT